MSKVLLARPIPVALLMTNRSTSAPPPFSESTQFDDNARRPSSGPRVALTVAALSLLGLACIGVFAAGLRPVTQSVTETKYQVAIEPPAELVLTTPVSVNDPAVEEEPNEPGEARPIGKNVRVAFVEEPTSGVVALPEPATAKPIKAPGCERFGTAIDFVRSQTIAFDRAAREQKLVMVLHVAGNFEDPGFT